MSLNSLQDDMSRRAASMAAMARRANNPQEIEAIQKSLITGVQNGSIQPYVGIPLIQDLTKKLTEAKAQMAQSVAGAGMPQPPADGPPIAQQVMQQAAQESQGVEALPSNLPQSYAGGGIIAFEGGGEVERYQNAGFTGGQEFGISDPVAEAVDDLKYEEKARLKAIKEAEARAKFLRDAGAPQAAEAEAKLAALKGPNPYDPATATLRRNFTNDPIPATPGAAAAPNAAPSAAIPGAGNFKNPILQTYAPTAATLPVRTMKDLTDLDAITKDAEAKKKTAFDTKAAASQKTLEDFDKPGFEAREEKLGKREAGQEKDSAIRRALDIMNIGFGVAGSKERSLAGALGKEGREGIQSLIQGEAASRAAMERLADARDNFEQQKVQAKKGNYQASQTAGREASQDVQAAIQLALAGAQAGNAQAISLYNTLTQGDIGRAGVLNQAEQLKLSGVEQQNRNAVSLAELGLKRDQLNQSAASANAQLQLGRERLNIIKGQIAAGDKRAQATLLQAENKIASTWQSSPDYQKAQAQSSKMPPVQAQIFMQQAFTQYRGNMLPSLMGGSDAGIPSFADAMKAME